ncbi:MAG TPA: ABC transporter permease [Anaerolineales bacterium]|nr:ABC transporter permease [Anaerolineales bacterium]
MTNYLIRRAFQMLGVLLISAVASYLLINLAPGGPLQGLRQLAGTSRFQITEEDIARKRAYYELDLFLPYRFSRWLIGYPHGPLQIGGKTYLADMVVGCRKPIEAEVVDSRGRYNIEIVGCEEDVTLADLEGRRTSRGILRGDFGTSWGILRDRPVSLLVWSRLPRTLELMGLSILISLVIAVPLGIYQAVKQYSSFDYTFTFIAFSGSSMPTFFFGIVMILTLSILAKGAGLPWLPPGDAVGVREYFIPILGTIQPGTLIDQVLHVLMPTAVLVLFNTSFYSRYVRSSMLEVLRQNYVRTARAKGLVEREVILKHALRNALIPFVTVVVFAIPGAFGGAIITETVFNWPGMGRLFIDALGRSDYPVTMSILLITAFLTVVATLLGDILYTFVDPRIRYT